MVDGKLSILVGTPAYNGMVHLEYLNSIIEFLMCDDISFTILTIGNESLVTRSRNKILAFFYHNKEFDYLMFFDADNGITLDGVRKLLSWKKDIIGAMSRLKDVNKVVYNITHVLEREGNSDLVVVDAVGTGVMLISRKLVNDTVEYAKKNNQIFYSNKDFVKTNITLKGKTDNIEQLSKQLKGKIEMYDVFKCGLSEDNEYLTEDYYFCRLAQKLGYKVYADLSVKAPHAGMITLL